MNHSQKNDSPLLIPALLGLAWLPLHILSYQSFSLGDILLFMSAIAFGLNGALASIAIGPIPFLLYSGFEEQALRYVLLFGFIGYFSGRYPRVPIYAPLLAISFISLGPLHLLMSSYSIVHYPQLLLQCLFEIFASATAGALLTYPAVWGMLRKKSRHYTAKHSFPLIFTSLTTVAMLLSLVPIWQDISWRGATTPELYAVIVLLLCCFPSILGWWMAHQIEQYRIQRSMHQSGSLRLDQAQSTGLNFSGASELHWTLDQHKSEVSMFAISDDGVLTYANDCFFEFAKISEQDAVGKRFNDLKLDKLLAKELLRLIALPIDETPSHTEIRLKRESGTQFLKISIECEGSLRSARLSSKVFRIEDISHARQLEPQVVFSQRSKALAHAISGLAHGFNNFLTNIIGQASYGKRTPDQHQQQQAFDEIIRSAERASGLVWTLMEFTDSRQPEKEESKSIELNEFVDDRVDLFKRIVGDRIELMLSCSSEPLGVEFDDKLLAYVLTEVVINARDAYPQGPGQVRIVIDKEIFGSEVSHVSPGARSGRFARIRVIDNGIGMSSETVAHACDPFYTTKPRGKHDGLGLASVFAAIRAHDGFMTIESFPNKGTTISLYLPIVRAPRQRLSTNHDEQAFQTTPINAPQKQILVVEDEPSVRDLITKMLSTLGYNVKSCANGEDAMKIAEEESFDLVITDIMMPKMSGIDLAKNLREKNGEAAKIVLMTGLHRDSDLEDLNGVLEKPFDMDTLAQRVQEAIQSS